MAEQTQKTPFKMSGDTEPSDVERAISSLTNPDNIDFITEIRNPIAITLMTIYGGYIKGQFPKTGARILEFVGGFKTNMTSFGRKRSGEIIDVTRAASGTSENKNARKLGEKLLGSL